jgi:hypothetical protein
MWQACRAAARRGSSRSKRNFNSITITSNNIQSASVVAIITALLVVNDDQKQQKKNHIAICQEAAAVEEDCNTYSRRATKHSIQRNNSHSHPPYRNFVQATSSSLPPQSQYVEHPSTSTSSYPAGVFNDLRLRRAVTSKRMAAEQSKRTFFSTYEVKFDDPLGSGKLHVLLHKYDDVKNSILTLLLLYTYKTQVHTEMSTSVKNAKQENH